MASYFDTSFLFKLYVTEPDSVEAMRLFQNNSDAAMVSWLTDVEMASSLYRTLPKGKAAQVHQAYLNDRATRVYQILPMLDDVFGLAVTLSERYSEQYRLRSLDVLHLATALRHGADGFGTYDGRLAEVAKLAGLRVLP